MLKAALPQAINGSAKESDRADWRHNSALSKTDGNAEWAFAREGMLNRLTSNALIANKCIFEPLPPRFFPCKCAVKYRRISDEQEVFEFLFGTRRPVVRIHSPRPNLSIIYRYSRLPRSWLASQAEPLGPG